MPTLLVTAFGAFPGAPSNPSRDVADLLTRRFATAFARAGIRLVAIVLPVVYSIAPRLDEILIREKPDAVLHLGLAGRRQRANVEMRARNRTSTIKADARGRFAPSHALTNAGSTCISSTWKATTLVAALQRSGVDATLSNDAGDYVCNALLWRSLESGKAPAIFIHVPPRRRLAPARLAAALARTLPLQVLTLTRCRARLAQGLRT